MGELVMYVLVNETIKISKGKLAGQVGHAVCSYMHKNILTEEYKIDAYMKNGIQKKIILRCSQEKLEELESLGYIAIRDLGLTQLDSNTLTCVNYGIHYKHQVPAWIQELKLY